MRHRARARGRVGDRLARLLPPIGGLTDVDPRADSLWDGDSKVPYRWREPLDDYLAATAERVAATVTFELGIIGYEVSGTVYRRDLEEPVAPGRGGDLIVSHDERWNGGYYELALEPRGPCALRRIA